MLEALGVVQVKPGADNGAFLLAEPGRAFRDLLDYQLALRQINIASLVEFRIVIESWAARAAAERADDAAFERMTNLIVLMKHAPLSYVGFHDYDANWHLEIARSTQNQLFALALEGARTTIERVMVGAVAGMVNWDTMRERIIAEHEAILEALRERDGVLASELMAAHIRNLRRTGLFGHRRRGPAGHASLGSPKPLAPALQRTGDGHGSCYAREERRSRKALEARRSIARTRSCRTHLVVL